MYLHVIMDAMPLVQYAGLTLWQPVVIAVAIQAWYPWLPCTFQPLITHGTYFVGSSSAWVAYQTVNCD